MAMLQSQDFQEFFICIPLLMAAYRAGLIILLSL